MVSLVQVEKLSQLEADGWFSDWSHADPMRIRVGGPTLIWSPDGEPHYVYASGDAVPLVPALGARRANCQCYRCLKESEARDENVGLPSQLACDTRFIVCSTCGNKRCPHATDHRLACTGSNEPGQEGSSYGPALRSPIERSETP